MIHPKRHLGCGNSTTIGDTAELRSRLGGRAGAPGAPCFKSRARVRIADGGGDEGRCAVGISVDMAFFIWCVRCWSGGGGFDGCPCFSFFRGTSPKICERKPKGRPKYMCNFQRQAIYVLEHGWSCCVWDCATAREDFVCASATKRRRLGSVHTFIHAHFDQNQRLYPCLDRVPLPKELDLPVAKIQLSSIQWCLKRNEEVSQWWSLSMGRPAKTSCFSHREV